MTVVIVASMALGSLLAGALAYWLGYRRGLSANIRAMARRLEISGRQQMAEAQRISDLAEGGRARTAKASLQRNRSVRG